MMLLMYYDLVNEGRIIGLIKVISIIFASDEKEDEMYEIQSFYEEKIKIKS